MLDASKLPTGQASKGFSYTNGAVGCTCLHDLGFSICNNQPTFVEESCFW